MGIENEFVAIDPLLNDLIYTWKSTGLGRLQLTTVGIVLARANIKKIVGSDLELSIWIKEKHFTSDN